MVIVIYTKNENSISVIIPCYNEAEYITECANEIKAVFPGVPVFVCDNNSVDNTDILAKSAGAYVIYEKTVQGKGAAVKKLLSEVDSDIYIMIDGDFTYVPTRDVLKPVLDGHADMVIADRLSGNYKHEAKFINKVGNKFLGFIYKKFGFSINDPLSGFRCFTKDFINSCQLSDGFEIETEMNFHALSDGYKVVNIPVSYRERQKADSKLKLFSDGFKILKKMFVLRRSKI